MPITAKSRAEQFQQLPAVHDIKPHLPNCHLADLGAI
jgi:hypothetical protein